MNKEEKVKFGAFYPFGPCNFKNCVCDCGWEYNKEEVDDVDCQEGCEICDYCGSEKCPKCGNHLHCGGCV